MSSRRYRILLPIRTYRNGYLRVQRHTASVPTVVASTCAASAGATRSEIVLFCRPVSAMVNLLECRFIESNGDFMGLAQTVQTATERYFGLHSSGEG